MTTFLLTHGSGVRELLGTPSRSPLREMIAQHSGPWEPGEVAALNKLELGGLHFEARNGQLHVRLAN